MKKKTILTLGLILLVLVLAGAAVLVLRGRQSEFSGDLVKNSDAYLLDIQRMNGTDSHTLTLKKGESVTLKDIPAGTLYEVLENTDTDTMHKGYETENPVRSGSITAATANAPAVALEFVNKREMGKLRITKTVEGTNPEANKAFKMTVLLTPANDSVVLGTTAEEFGTTANITVTKTGESGEKREITFALKDGESIELSRIPVGTTYMVVEDSTYTGRTYPGGPYTVTYTPATINTTAQVITSETAQVTVLNVRNAYGGLTITKLLDDAIMDGLQGEGVSYGANLEFQFKLKLRNAQYKLDETYGYTKKTSAGEQNGTLTLTEASEDGREGKLTFTLKGGESITFNYANPGEARATGLFADHGLTLTGLDLPEDRVQVIMGDTARTVNQGGASNASGVSQGSIPLRNAAAEARLLLVTSVVAILLIGVVLAVKLL
mgnify:CR=1 FL=1